VVERQFQVVVRQTQVAERRSGPFRLNLTTGNSHIILTTMYIQLMVVSICVDVYMVLLYFVDKLL